MNTFLRPTALAWTFVVSILVAAPRAVADAASDRFKTLSPYFVVNGTVEGVETLPLESSKADVAISGVIADVVVTQAYRNSGEQPISARYVFPASTRAAVHGMTMTIGARVIEAKIREREAARAEYEQAKSEGKTASLLEQERPNVFSMNVANILPGDHVEVTLRYTELLVPTDGVYELVLPTVVGPRYAGASTQQELPQDAQAERSLAPPYQHAGRAPRYDVGINVALAAGMPITQLVSPSHAIHTAWSSSRHDAATVELAPGTVGSGDRDFVLRYRLAGDRIASGLLLHEGAGESFFLLMVQPPQRPEPDLVPPREYVFVVDVSGSMYGFPLDVAKRLMRDLLSRLRPTDTFDVLLFAGGSSLFAPASVAATLEHVNDATAFIENEHGGGGTELLPALETAMSLPRPSAAGSRSIVVVTDGFIAEERAAFDLVREKLGETNVFAFGIGSSVNRHLIEGLARAGQGEPAIVLDEVEAPAAAARFREQVETPVLTHVRVDFNGLQVHDVEPAAVPDVFANRPVIVFGKYDGPPRGSITVSGESGRGKFTTTIDVASCKPDTQRRGLAYLWARARIADLSDWGGDDAHRDAVVDLGLRYNLLTRYTSFIAVQHVVRAPSASTDVDQPLPLPAGVSDLAVVNSPEPPLAALLALAALALAWRRARIRRLA